MSKYDDNEFLTDSAEEIREREQQEIIRRTIREEIRRISSSDDEGEEEGEEEESGATGHTPKWIGTLGAILSGEILVRERVKGGYNYLLYIAMLYLASIVIIFSSLHLEIKRNRLAKEVELLHEKSWRMTEERNACTSHSAIVRAIEERGLGLTDPISPITIVEEGDE